MIDLFCDGSKALQAAAKILVAVLNIGYISYQKHMPCKKETWSASGTGV